MPDAISKNSMEAQLKQLIQDILQDDSVNIDPHKSLMTDYGLDSLDLLDFSFSIEEKYDVQIGPHELQDRVTSKISKEDIFDENGNISRQALTEFKECIPEIPAEAFVYGIRPEDIPSLLNIKIFVRIIIEKLATQKDINSNGFGP